MNFQKSSKQHLSHPLIFGHLFCFFFGKRLKKSCIKVQHLQYNLWIENDPPPLWNFSKIHPFWYHPPPPVLQCQDIKAPGHTTPSKVIKVINTKLAQSFSKIGLKSGH